MHLVALPGGVVICIALSARRNAGTHAQAASKQVSGSSQVRLYQRFTFDLVPGQEPLKLHTTITISPAGGLHMRVVPRAKPA